MQHQWCVPSTPMSEPTPNPLRTDDLDFELPKELIATRPVEPRDSSRLLVVQRSDPGRLEHRVFADLPKLLSPDDLLVFNRSRVVPARLIGVREGFEGAFEGLFLSEHHSRSSSDPESNTKAPMWIAMVRAKRTKPGKQYRLIDAHDRATEFILELVEKHEPSGPGAWIVRVSCASNTQAFSKATLSTEEILDRVGRTPLPPYIVTQRKARDQHIDDDDDRSCYQTMFASETESGSVAAPTAGLHFTPKVFKELGAQKIDTTEVVLHVGAGTFKPVETETLNEHQMHEESCSLADAEPYFSPVKTRRTIAIGSTSARTLESYAQLASQSDQLPQRFSTDILIAPGYRWRWVDGMVTNFHLPRSTLMAMIASILEIEGEPSQSGLERVHRIYREAVNEQYRFFSYGDAMLILP
jgi:S-adenosylmethionine:tRNA ribosyltransferase-isomerase